MVVHPSTPAFFLIFCSIFSPPLITIKPIKKNRSPRPTNEATKNGTNAKPVIPDAMVNILYGIGENPEIRTIMPPHSSIQPKISVNCFPSNNHFKLLKKKSEYTYPIRYPITPPSTEKTVVKKEK